MAYVLRRVVYPDEELEKTTILAPVKQNWFQRWWSRPSHPIWEKAAKIMFCLWLVLLCMLLMHYWTGVMIANSVRDFALH